MDRITFKDFWNTEEELAIHCDTKSKAKKFYEESNKLCKTWCGGEEYKMDHFLLKIDDESLCLSNNGQFGDKCFYEEDKIKVFEFDDICWED